jgi:hypothetical protein
LLASYANEATAEPLPDKRKVIARQQSPLFDPKTFEALVDATKTQFAGVALIRSRTASKSAAPRRILLAARWHGLLMRSVFAHSIAIAD